MKYHLSFLRFLSKVPSLFGLVASPLSAQAPAQIHKFLANDGAFGDGLGNSVSLSGSLALVGASNDNHNGVDSGSAYLFDVRTGQQLRKLTPNDGAAYDAFGESVSLSGNLALVGAPQDEYDGSFSGSAYLFNVNTGQQLRKFTPNDRAAHDWFGSSVSISGNFALVGAFLDDDNGDASGSVYVFNISTGQQVRKLYPNDGASDDEFGSSVVLVGNLALVGGGGSLDSAYLFDVTSGQQLRKLTPESGASGIYFGSSVSLSGNFALIGAFRDRADKNGPYSGSAYLFDITTGQQLHRFVANDAFEGDTLGISVSLSENYAFIGAWTDDDNGRNSGSAYVFDLIPNVKKYW